MRWNRQSDEEDSMNRLEGKVAIITGAGRGIGRATAVRLAAEGAAVVVNDIDGEVASGTVALIETDGGRARSVVADTCHMDAATALVAEAIDAFGKLDIVVNNAGMSRDKMFHRMDDDLFDSVIEANLKTAFHTTLAATQHMRETAKREIESSGAAAYHRKITFTASASALNGNPGQYNYSAAKGALIATTRTLARELAPFAINVNAVAPGMIDTRMTREREPGGSDGIPADARAALIADIPMGRTGSAEEVAAVLCFLVSGDSDYVTGATIPVAGGMLGSM
jgi:3-oxoacyl-[acyl-carrier protein] reductase